MTAARREAPLLQVQDLSVVREAHVGWRRTRRQVLDRVSFSLARGEVLGLVGGSGAGKTTLAHALAGLVPFQGQASLDGVPLGGARGADRRRLASRLQLVMQDPGRSLDPRQRVGRIVGEGAWLHQQLRGAALRRQVAQTLELVGLDPSFADRYPHQCSGGQRQRIALARALVVEPELLVCDEPVSALDVSVQARVLCLLEDLRQRLGLTLLFISHDLRVVGALCQRVLVLHRGQVVEEGTAAQVLETPRHPHTRAMKASLPRPAGAP